MYPDLRPVCLVLKKLVKDNNLNEPYTGGIGSYSMFLLLLYVHFNFKRHYPYSLPHDTYPGQLYILFLSEMKDFDFNTYMISYESDKRIDDLFLNKAY